MRRLQCAGSGCSARWRSLQRPAEEKERATQRIVDSACWRQPLAPNQSPQRRGSAERVTSLRPLMDNALRPASSTRRVAHRALKTNASLEAPGWILLVLFLRRSRAVASSLDLAHPGVPLSASSLRKETMKQKQERERPRGAMRCEWSVQVNLVSRGAPVTGPSTRSPVFLATAVCADDGGPSSAAGSVVTGRPRRQHAHRFASPTRRSVRSRVRRRRRIRADVTATSF
jgi:hypothetical protein